jgi:hypothetical protein
MEGAMALEVAKVITIWSDPFGKRTRAIYNIRKRIAAGVMNRAQMGADASGVAQAIENLTRLKFEEARLILPLDISGWSVKENPTQGFSVLRQAFQEFLGAPGDSTKRSKTRIFVPAPLPDVLGGNETYLDPDNSGVEAFIEAVMNNALTVGGTNIVAVGRSNVRTRVTRK